LSTRALGPFTVSAIGLGAMPLSMGGHPVPDDDRAMATVHAALDAGVTYIDTADIYAPSWDTMGHNERIVGRALATYRGSTDHVVVGTKGGITRAAGERWGRDASMGYLRTAVDASLRALGREAIDLYQWHRPDRSMAFAEGIANFRVLRDEGKVRAVGVSNTNAEEIDIALEILGDGGLASVQNEFSPRHRSSRDELQHCAEIGVAFLPWSPLGGIGSAAKSVGDRYTAFRTVADAHGVSPQRVVLAWELALGGHVIPIPGASRPESIIDSARAADLVLTEEDLALLGDAMAD
jgi:aryl-alcohol dehydrogenase-like predicted oxidoreductase